VLKSAQKEAVAALDCFIFQ